MKINFHLDVNVDVNYSMTMDFGLFFFFIRTLGQIILFSARFWFFIHFILRLILLVSAWTSEPMHLC